MNRARASLIVAGVAAAGIAGSLLVGRLGGMGKGDLLRLVLATLPALAGTVLAVIVAQPLMAKASIVWRMVTIAVVAALVTLADLILASRMMFVSDHDAQVLATMAAFSAAAGIGTALALARPSRLGVDRLRATAARLADGDLSARVGPLDAEPDIRTLGATFDEMAERISESIERDRALEALRRDLFTSISHDLRTPLARLRMIVDALEDGVIGEEDVPRYLGEIRGSVQVLTKMADDLFEVVRAEGEDLARAGTAPLRSVVEAAVRTCDADARERGIPIRVELDGAGDAPCSPRLERVLQNLLSNAVRYSSEGEITARGRLEGSDLVIEVEDDGAGIDPSQLPMVFEPFWRGDAARSKPGNGLGLTLAKRLVEHLGGTIEVTSRVGQGTRFTVTLPRA